MGVKAKVIIGVILVVVVASSYFIFKKEPIVYIEPVITEEVSNVSIIGQSVDGRDIESYTYGNGDTHLLFIGGVHGGYELNSVLLSYELIDHFEVNSVPENITATVIPNLNPDGVYSVIAKEGRFTQLDIPAGVDTSVGRFNANAVDLNRNFDCKWKPESMWRSKVVDAGSSAFSEPETVALRDFVLKNEIDAAVFYHSQANTVYASECENGILPITLDVMNIYATAAQYGRVEKFDAYPVVGDAEGWLASIGIPAVTVELENHTDIDWERNLKGVEALFEYFR